ncbi:4243_t:CDS:2, partial [Racocetra fulgida]
RAENQQTVQCKIKYKNGQPEFQILYGTFFEFEVKSNTSVSKAVKNYKKAITRNSNKNARQHIKPAEQYSQKTLIKHAKEFATILKQEFIRTSELIYNTQDSVSLKSLKYTINNQNYYFNIGDKNLLQQKAKILNIIKVMDSSYISRDAYRDLAAINFHLPHEYIIANERNNLTQEIINKIQINLINMIKAINNSNLEEEPNHIDIIPDNIDTNTINVNEISRSEYIGEQRDFKEILRYIISYLIQENVLSANNPTIHIRISGDSQNVDRKLLEIILNPFFNDLKDLKNNVLNVADILWNFEFYFSSDWKFLSICLGLKAANSKYFCAWCSCSKNKIGDATQDWRITKSINDLKINYSNTPSHIKAPLFDIIPLYNYVFDELHVLLRIEDRLWTLILSELKERNLFNEVSWQIIVKEIE